MADGVMVDIVGNYENVQKKDIAVVPEWFFN